MKYPVWELVDIYKILLQWQLNEFDGLVVICGHRGLGKSSSAVKLASKYRDFNFEKNIIFKRDEIMNFLDKNKFSVMVADEMINVSYNRDFYSEEQKKLIKMLNMYRDNCNILIACVPNFYDLDKQFRQLCKVRIDIIRRGLGLLHMPLQSVFMPDKWDTDNNSKIEKGFLNNRGDFKPNYNRISTFRGYVKLDPLTLRQAEIYKELKERKRNVVFLDESGTKKNLTELDKENKNLLYKKIADSVIQHPINQRPEFITSQCAILGITETTFKSNLNAELSKQGYRISDFIKKNKN